MEDIPEEILVNIIQEATSNHTPSCTRVLVTPERDFAALERATDILLACRLVSKKFSRIATTFSSPPFLELLPRLRAVTKGAKFSATDINSATIGHCVASLSDLLWLKRLRHAMPFIIEKLFAKSEDRTKAQSIFSGITYLAANPEVYATYRIPNEPLRVVVLESFRQMSQYIKLFGGSVHLLEGQTDVRSIAPKKLRKIFAGPEHFLGMLSRSDICVKTKLILHGKAINQLATDLGCPEWSLADQEKEFLLPRFLLAVNGFPNLALKLTAENFSLLKKSPLKPVVGSPFVANKIPLKENEVPPVTNQHKLVEVFQQIKQHLIDLKPTFHLYEDVIRFYTLLKNYVDAWVISSLQMAQMEFDDDTSSYTVKKKEKYVQQILPLVEFVRFRSTFVEAPENQKIDFLVARVNDYAFKIVFSDSLELNVTVEILTAWAGYQIVCIYISGIGWKEMNEALRETKAERLMISYVGPHKRNRSVNQYPNFNFRHPNVIKSIDAVLNQFVVATDFSLE
jgi:hypothetical protein